MAKNYRDLTYTSDIEDTTLFSVSRDDIEIAYKQEFGELKTFFKAGDYSGGLYYADGSQTIPSGVSTTLEFQVKEFDIANEFSSDTTFTPSKPGYYHLNYHLEFSSATSPTNFFATVYFRPGSKGSKSFFYDPTWAGPLMLSGDYMLYLPASDSRYISITHYFSTSITLVDSLSTLSFRKLG